MDRGKKEEFGEILGQYVERGSDFYVQVSRAYDILHEVRERSDGHGITLVLKKDDNRSSLDRYMEHAQPYNGKPHNLNDSDITDVVASKREKDLATIVNSVGDIVGANVPLPMDVVAYQDKYDISIPIAQLLGYARGEDAPGARTQSALCATDKIGDAIMIITLGETRPDGKKGPINAYFCGDRIYSSSGRQMQWQHASRRPTVNTVEERKVIDFDAALKSRRMHGSKCDVSRVATYS